MASSSDSDSDDPPRPAIFDAIYAFDAEALRRELAAGVDPNVSYDGYTPLFNLVLVRAARYPEERIQERLECISLLLEAGASVDFRHLIQGTLTDEQSCIALRIIDPQHTPPSSRHSWKRAPMSTSLTSVGVPC